MEETRIEKHLKNRVKKQGCLALKFTVPGMSGMPDRLILLPGGKVYFVELKKPGGKLKKLQQKRAEMLKALGFSVYCLDSNETVDSFIKEVFSSNV